MASQTKPSQEPTSKEQDFVESQLKDQEDQQHFFNDEAQAVAVFFRAEEIEDYQDTVARNTQTLLLEYGTLLASQFHTKYKERFLQQLGKEKIEFGQMGCKNLTEALTLSQLQSVCFVTGQGTGRMRLWELRKFKYGEILYPLVRKIGRESKPEIILNDLVGKITGMLLELENHELDCLVESGGNASLKKQITSAEEVLDNFTLDIGSSQGSSLNPTAPSFTMPVCSDGDRCKRADCLLLHPGRDNNKLGFSADGLEQLAEIDQTERLRGASHLRLSYETAVVDESRTTSQLCIERRLVADIRDGGSCEVVAVSSSHGSGGSEEASAEKELEEEKEGVSDVAAGGGDGGAGEQKTEVEAAEGTTSPIYCGQLEKKGLLGRNNWAFRHFELHKAKAELQISYFNCTGPDKDDSRTLKGSGIVSGVTNVPDRNWKRKNRFDIVLSSHSRRECPCSIQVAAKTKEEKAAWLAAFERAAAEALAKEDAKGRSKAKAERAAAEAKAAVECVANAAAKAEEERLAEQKRLGVEADAAEAEVERQVKKAAAEEKRKVGEKARQKQKAAAEEANAAAASVAAAEAKANLDAQRAAAGEEAEAAFERAAAEAQLKAEAAGRSKVEAERAVAQAKAAAQREAAEAQAKIDAEHVAQAKAKAEAERAAAEAENERAAAKERDKAKEEHKKAEKANQLETLLENLRAVFDPVEFDCALDRLDEEFCSGTRKWVFDQVKEWKSDLNKPRVFVCLGLPG
jgi:hypothetical protein